MKSLLFLILFVFLQKANAQNFTLKGTFEGPSPEMLYLIYWDMGIKSMDSSEIKNGKFFFKGTLSEPVLAILTDDSRGKDLKHGNYLRDFYIEPGKMKIGLNASLFSEAKLLGSKSNDEYESLKKKVDPLLDCIGVFNQRMRRDSLNNKNVSDSLKYYKAQAKALLLLFIKGHHNSIVSAKAIGWLSRYGVCSDSVLDMYNGLPSTIKNGYFVSKSILILQGIRKSVIGSQAPEFVSTDINGVHVKLSDFKGKFVLLDFWASWCIPCRDLTPILKEWYHAYKPKGLEIISISSDDNIENWKKAVFEDQTSNWHPIINQDWSINNKYNIAPIPNLILIDTNGIIIGRYLGKDEVKDNLRRKLNEIFGN